MIRSKVRGKKEPSNLVIIKNNFAEILRPSIDSLNASNDPNKLQLGIVQVANSNAEQHALLKQAIDNFGGVLPNVNRTNSHAALVIQANSILALTEELIKRAFNETQRKPITREDARTAINQLSRAYCLLWTSSNSLTLEQKMFQIYLFRAVLYSKFSKRNFTAFRLNANATFSYLTGEYSRKVRSCRIKVTFCLQYLINFFYYSSTTEKFAMLAPSCTKATLTPFATL